jgi:hypothetical protein
MPDVSEEHAATILRVTELVPVEADIYVSVNIAVIRSSDTSLLFMWQVNVDFYPV